MRMDQSQGQTAYELLKNLREDELADLIYKYGDERLSRKIAKFIKTSWPIKNSTKDLAALVCRAYPKKRHKIHPATRTFQALRVAVNNELEELETLLNSITKILAPGGRIAIISFQSHEDRLVKHFFRNLVKEDTGYKLINKRPIIASPEELAANPRARSAKLRVLQRIL